MKWLYKFLLKVIDDKCCVSCGCTTCGSTEFRATLIAKLNTYKKIPNITKLSKFNNRNYFEKPLYYQLDQNIKKEMIEEISSELNNLTHAQINRLEELSKGTPILRALFYEFSDQSEYLYSLLVGTPAGIYLKKMIDHHRGLQARHF